MNDYSYIGDNLTAVRKALSAAARRSGRAAPRLVAVTKSATPEEFLALVETGIGDIAENRVPLFRDRLALLDRVDRHPDFHLIGSLQTNKVKYLIGKTALIQSLDSIRLAAEIDRLSRVHGCITDVLVEVNSGREAAKGGVFPEDIPAFLASLAAYPTVRVCGLMTMGPVSPDPETLRPYFRATRELFLSCRFAVEKPVLSMGMSDSYTVAAEEGATMVRVGRALFRKPAETTERKDESR